MSREDEKQEQTKTDRLQLGLNFFAGAAFLGAVLRVTDSSKGYFEKLDTTTLLYLGVAGALLMMRQVKSLAFGDFKVELDQIKKVAEEARNLAQVAENAAQYQVAPQAQPVTKNAFVAPHGQAVESVEAAERVDENEATSSISPIVPGKYHNDPWKGVFGGKNEVDNRRLWSTVTPMSGTSDWYKIHLTVESTSPKNSPVKGSVQFFLHDTFNNDRPIVPVRNGIAELYLKAWGAFTVGALADDGRTRLELDLSELSDAPHKFRVR